VNADDARARVPITHLAYLQSLTLELAAGRAR